MAITGEDTDSQEIAEVDHGHRAISCSERKLKKNVYVNNSGETAVPQFELCHNTACAKHEIRGEKKKLKKKTCRDCLITSLF